jgi:hypothetical protein
MAGEIVGMWTTQERCPHTQRRNKPTTSVNLIDSKAAPVTSKPGSREASKYPSAIFARIRIAIHIEIEPSEALLAL